MTNQHFDEGCLGDDLDLARRALAAGDLAHAFFHGSFALQDASFDLDQTLALVREIYARAPDERALLQRGMSYAEAIAMAVGRASKGDYGPAIDLASDALQVVPRAYGAELIAEWIRAWGRAPLSCARAMHAAFGQTIGWLRLRPAQTAIAKRYAPIAKAVLDAREFDANAVVMAGGVLRRAGDGEGVLRVAKRLIDSGGETHDAWIQIGLAQRLLRNTDESLAAFRRAKELGGDPTTIGYELARALSDAHRYDEAAAVLPPAMADDRSTENRVMQGWYAEHRARTPGVHHRWLGDAPVSDDFRLAGCSYAVGHMTPYDASTNTLRDERLKSSSSLVMHCTAMESPSCRMALALFAQRGADPREAPYTFSKTPEPDPRSTDGAEVLNVWAYDERGPYAVNAPPGPEVRAAIEAVLARPLNVTARWNEARRLGPSLGPSRVVELLGACSCEPFAKGDGTIADAVFEQQLAAVFLLANVDSGWFDSTRRRALVGVLRSVIDWVTLAAVIALREVALDEPDAGAEVCQEFGRLVPRVSLMMAPWLEEALVSAFERVPGVTAQDTDGFAATMRPPTANAS